MCLCVCVLRSSRSQERLENTYFVFSSQRCLISPLQFSHADFMSLLDRVDTYHQKQITAFKFSLSQEHVRNSGSSDNNSTTTTTTTKKTEDNSKIETRRQLVRGSSSRSRLVIFLSTLLKNSDCCFRGNAAAVKWRHSPLKGTRTEDSAENMK